jgi:hypothetical protein
MRIEVPESDLVTLKQTGSVQIEFDSSTPVFHQDAVELCKSIDDAETTPGVIQNIQRIQHGHRKVCLTIAKS